MHLVGICPLFHRGKVPCALGFKGFPKSVILMIGFGLGGFGLGNTPKTMFKKCQQIGESLEFLKEIGDRPESQVKKWGLSRGVAS